MGGSCEPAAGRGIKSKSSGGKLISDTEIRAILSHPQKLVTRQFNWMIEASGHTPKSYVFESSVKAGNTVLEGVTVRARYRGVKLITKGAASISVPESFSCALFVGDERVAALDTNPVQAHTNKVGDGLPHFGRTIRTPTHRHIWVGCYGYVEPVEPPLLDVVQLIRIFANELDMTFQGTLQHPLKGVQMGLGL